tara:strand:+ start:293 stop:532 length:240 start_codon:yes stop_codon:yes gene_type:complete
MQIKNTVTVTNIELNAIKDAVGFKMDALRHYLWQFKNFGHYIDCHKVKIKKTENRVHEIEKELTALRELYPGFCSGRTH